jgi:F-type H+-transporting ATPase subunit a
MTHPLTVFDLMAPYLSVTISTLLACLCVTLAVAFFVRSGLRSSDGVIPEGRLTLRNMLELMLEGMVGLARQVIGEDWPRWMPLIGTIGFFILVSNLMGLIPGLANPTSFVETNLAWALIAFFAFHYAGIQKHGLGSYLKHFAGPVWWLAPLMFPLEVWSTVVRILSLTVRLTANMFADHTLVAVFLSFPVIQIFVPWAMMGLGLFVAFLQAFIFAFLTMIYIGMALEEAH